MLSLLEAKTKNTHIRAIANSLYEQGYISIKEGVNLENLTREDITVVKSIFQCTLTCDLLLISY